MNVRSRIKVNTLEHPRWDVLTQDGTFLLPPDDISLDLNDKSLKPIIYIVICSCAELLNSKTARDVEIDYF